MPVLPAHWLWFLFTCQLISQLPGIICLFLRLASISWSLWTTWSACWAFFKPTLHVESCIPALLLFSHSVVSDSLRPQGLQHARLPCPLLSSRVCPNSCPLNRWCHPTISSSVAPFSSCPHSFPEVTPKESPLHIMWPKYWSLSLSSSPSNEYSGLISLRIDWFDFLAVQGTLKSSPAPQFKSMNFGECSSRLRLPWNSHNYFNFISKIKGPLFQLLLLLPQHS